MVSKSDPVVFPVANFSNESPAAAAAFSMFINGSRAPTNRSVSDAVCVFTRIPEPSISMFPITSTLEYFNIHLP
ncbi:hypothetical protein HanIR_Chr17g0857111 [Helianthus annuus]|nr:hypothetical protein HanIR_Chr17g0857111 [Helianthus annuus]